MAYSALTIEYIESPATPINKSSPFIPGTDYETSDYDTATELSDGVYVERNLQCLALIGGVVVP